MPIMRILWISMALMRRLDKIERCFVFMTVDYFAEGDSSELSGG